ncbi:MAG: NADP-dependent oxidoreductase [Thermoanaerobaculia bacterium]
MNTQILFKSRPSGEPHEQNFRIVHHGIPTPSHGEVVRRTIYLSLDPYVRGRMSTASSYVEPMEFGQVVVGGTVSEVIDSQNPDFREGDIVLGADGWQTYGVSDGSDLRKIDPSSGPISWALGLLGMPGLTAYVAVDEIAQAKEGETIVVTSAAGAVGSVAVQIAKIRGCRVVGFAGTDAKCSWVQKELGANDCINYKTAALGSALAAATPDGIDADIENVGGAVFEGILQRINRGARIALVGLIAHYNDRKPQPGPSLRRILSQRATIRGMIVSDHYDRFPEFLRDMRKWIEEGKMKAREHVVEGLENAPGAFLGLFHGENFGKLLVKVSDDPTQR